MTFWSGALKNDLKNGPKTGVFDAILTRFTKKFTLVRGKIFCFGCFEVLKDFKINVIFTWDAQSATLMYTNKPVKVGKPQISV